MTDMRHKNMNWSIFKDQFGNWSVDKASLAVLMDIRDELQTLNTTMRCSRVARMADAMIRAERRLASRLPLRANCKRKST